MHSSLYHLVFTQTDTSRFPTETVTAHARRFHRSGLEVVGGGSVFGPASAPETVALRFEAHGHQAVFRVSQREVTEDDLAAAARAEASGKAAGMASLARRCARVWSVAPAAGAPEWLVLELCALLASVALGPVLPPDQGTLLGVRSARERAERLRRGT